MKSNNEIRDSDKFMRQGINLTQAELEERMEHLRQETFLEGYKYAITVLQEGLVQKD